jgi:23S rRNA (cytidine1920-2'-O)/16S rRNA (cytidine1409-2'-O)-methyltransferase
MGLQPNPLPKADLTGNFMRADEALVAQGLADSRSRARALIEGGMVLAGDKPVTKPSWTVPAGTVLSLNADDPNYASRGAYKLLHGLERFKIDVTDKTVLDLGAATGGFTDILLRRGAGRVFAVDVGHGQMIKRLADDPRVGNLEGMDARHLTAEIIPEPVHVITADLAFISLIKAIGPALGLAASGCDLVALVKPQFEVGRQGIGKGGIVRDPDLRKQALDQVIAHIDAMGSWHVCDQCESPITGGDGNVEFLIHARCD